MIDGIQIKFETSKDTYLLSLVDSWEILVNEKSHLPINEIRSMNMRGLHIQLKPALHGFNFIINGSLHKFHNGGNQNHDQFTFSKLQQSIDSLTNIFELNAEKCTIHGVEIGVNVILPFPANTVLKNMVCYDSRPFININTRSLKMGWKCALSQHSIKAYNKGLQSNIADCNNLLRFEVSVDKMQYISKYKIVTLADLQNVQKIYPLVNELEKAYNRIVWTDKLVNLNRLSNREQKQWLNYRNPKTWQGFKKSNRYKGKKIWHNLLHKYGNPPNLLPYIKASWESLFKNEKEAVKGRPIYHDVFKHEAVKKATFLQQECTVKRSLITIEKSIGGNSTFPITKNHNINTKSSSNKIKENKYCLSCCRDITTQRKGSKFCSELRYGRVGKKCRNKSSNHRRKINALIKNAKVEK